MFLVRPGLWQALRRLSVAWWWAAAALAVAVPAAAQTNTLRFRHLGTEQGLSQSAVMAIHQDRRGFVWLGTQDGLDRYDGVEFLHFRHYPDPADKKAGLSGNFIRALAEDRSGRIWIGTDTSGLDRYDPASGELRNFRQQQGQPASLPGNRVRALALDPGGWLWVATADGGLAHLDPATGDAIAYRHDSADPDSLADDNLSSLLVDRRGRLWIGTRRGLDLHEPAGGRFRHYGGDAVRALYEDRRGRLWIGTLAGLDLLDPDSGAVRHFKAAPGDPYGLGNPPVRALIEDPLGRLWVGTDQGIHIFDEEKGRFEHHGHDYSRPGSLSRDVVTTFYRDRGGLLWIGTQGGSANIWDPAGLRFGHVASRPDEPGSLSSDNIQAFAEAGGKLWVGTLGGGMNALDRTSGRFEVFRAAGSGAGLADDRVMSLAADRAGGLWIGTFAGGLQRLDLERRSFESWRHREGDPRSLAVDSVSSLLADRRGRLWIGSFGGGLARFEPRGRDFDVYRFAPDDPGSLPGDAVLALAEAPDGGIFVSTNGGGIAYLAEPGGPFLRLSPAGAGEGGGEERQALAAARSLYAGEDGALWVGTGDAGLVLVESFDRTTGAAAIRRFSARENAPNGTVWGIQPGAQGRLWLSTNRGLVELDPQKGSFRAFTARHGLQGDEFNFGAHFRGAGGELYFGGNHGYNVFPPSLPAASSQPPAVVITKVVKSGEVLRPEALHGSPPLVELDHRDSVLTIELAALDFAAPEENRYRFRLEGFDDGWSPPAKYRPATFTNLDPGNYTFRVAAANADGVWNEDGASLAVKVLPAPWATWWALALYLLGAAALIGFGIRWRLAGLERARRELVALVGQRTGELSRTVEQLRLSEQSAMGAKMRALRALEDALEERRKAQEANRAKSTFLSNVSHELRTPLNAVLGFAQLMERDESLGGEQRENLGVILRSGEHLLGLINDVLSFAKIESGRLSLASSPFELRRVLRDVEDMMRVRADAKGLRLEVEVESALPSVAGDEGRLKQVLLNLLGNAVKFTSEGSVRLVVSWREGRAAFSVIDTGCGITEAELAQLFQPFVQARGGRHHGEGTGLGLAICHRLVSLMGGELEVKSTPGMGSTFSFAIPLPAAALGAAAPRRGRVLGLAPGQPPCRILVADDAAENRDLLVRLLAKVGFEMKAVADGKAAVEAWSSFAPRLILMDIRMPILDGYGAIRRIRQAEAELGGRTAIVAITATAFEHDRRRMFAAGCDAVLTKPFRGEALFELLAEQLDLKFVYAEGAGDGGEGAPDEVEIAAPAAAPPEALEPAAPPPAAKAAKPAGPRLPPEPGGGLALEGRRILVVDDNDANQQVAQRTLEKLGCRVDLAGDGIEALAAAAAVYYDLILMDLRMPRLGGLEAARRLRAEEGPNRATPVVALTGMPSAEEHRSCLAAGMSDLLAKPFKLDDLRRQVERWSRPGAGKELAAKGPPKAAQAAAQAAEQRPAAAESANGALAGQAEGAPPAPAAKEKSGGDGVFQAGLDDSREVYVAEIIKLFLETAPFQLEALRTAAGGADLGRLAHLAATLRGSSLNFGATELSAACQRIGDLCADPGGGDHKAKIGEAIEELARELQLTIQHLRQLQAGRAAGGRTRANGRGAVPTPRP
jgi:signal transduction histidine kinase/ligand-binding sensor domain-containing protein/DNA-binding response OmpR family regulator/HPt (histidine-containing phosphotransfer) domain-containing protein